MIGFGVCIAKTGRRSFVAQAKIRRSGGRTRRVVLGSWPAMSVESARTAARQILESCAGGIDPVRERTRKPIPTLGEFIPVFIEHGKQHKRSWWKDLDDLNRYLPAAWRSRRLDEFEPGKMSQLHTTLATRGHYSANGFLRLLRSVFNKARDLGALPRGRDQSRPVHRLV
jgi:hypothetical protein